MQLQHVLFVWFWSFSKLHLNGLLHPAHN